MLIIMKLALYLELLNAVIKVNHVSNKSNSIMKVFTMQDNSHTRYMLFVSVCLPKTEQNYTEKWSSNFNILRKETNTFFYITHTLYLSTVVLFNFGN